MSVTVAIIHNPFRHHERVVKQVEFHPGKGMAYYADMAPALIGVELVASLNGLVVKKEESPIIKDGDFLAICPVVQGGEGEGKDIVRMVAMIAVIIVANVYGGALAANYGWGAFGQTLATAAIATAGSLVVNAVLPASMPDVGQIGRDTWNESPTYGWGKLRQSQGEGLPIQVLYGTHRVSGHELTKFVTVIGDKQYYNWMGGVGHGEITISDIRINDQPSSYFNGVETYTRTGTLNDAVIPGFDRVVSQVDHGQLLSTGSAVTHQTTGNAVELLDIDVTAPYGCFYANNSGGLDYRGATFKIEYKEVSSGTWITEGTTFEIAGATTSAIRKTVTITFPAAAKYDWRITRMNAEVSTSRERTTIYLISSREIINQALIYPGLAKYAVKALATDQLSGGEPSFSCLATRATVQVYDPATEQWVSRAATNPAWAYYDHCVLHHGVSHLRMDYDRIKAWADYCDELVGGNPRFKINIYFDTHSDFWTRAQQICLIGRAAPIRRGSIYSVTVDMPATPVHLFTTGNIKAGTFKLTYLPVKDRANAFEITYTDEDRDYTRQTVAVYSDEYNGSTSPDNKRSLRLFGATNLDQVIREGAFRINCNKHLTRSIEFDVDIDGLACQVGDLFYFQHDVPNWGISGRIVSATTTTVTLDREVTLAAGASYSILIRRANDTILDKAIAVVGTETTTDTLTFSVALAPANVPGKHDVFGFGLLTSYKRIYRLVQISRAGDLSKKLSALEYNSAIYTDTGFVFDQPAWSVDYQEATHVFAHESIVYAAGGGYASTVNLTWHPSITTAGTTWEVWLKNETAGTPFVPLGTTNNLNFTVSSDYLTLGHEYSFYISLKGQGPVDLTNNTVSVTIQGEQAPPSNVTSFSGTFNPITRSVNLTYGLVADIDISHYHIKKGGTAWGTGSTTIIPASIGGVDFHYIDDATSGTVRFWIKAVDQTGNESDTAAYCDVAVDTSLATLQVPSGLTASTFSEIGPDGSEQVYVKAVWNNNAKASDKFHHYEVSITAASWAAANTTDDEEFTWPVTGNVSYDVTVRAVDIAGIPTAWATPDNITSASDSTPPAQVTWPASGSIVAGYRLIGLNWNASSDSDLKHYELERSDDGTFTGEEVQVGFSAANYFIDSPLTKETQYWYRVRAIDLSGNPGSWSAVKTETTTGVGSGDIAANSILASHLATTIALTTILQSSNYVSGTSGFKLDGGNNTAEFNGTTVKVKAGSSNDLVVIDGNDATYRLYIGHATAASAPFSVQKNGTVTIKSGTSGERLEIYNNVIKVYDSSGTLRVKLGDLTA